MTTRSNFLSLDNLFRALLYHQTRQHNYTKYETLFDVNNAIAIYFHRVSFRIQSSTFTSLIQFRHLQFQRLLYMQFGNLAR